MVMSVSVVNWLGGSVAWVIQMKILKLNIQVSCNMAIQLLINTYNFYIPTVLFVRHVTDEFRSLLL